MCYFVLTQIISTTEGRIMKPHSALPIPIKIGEIKLQDLATSFKRT